MLDAPHAGDGHGFGLGAPIVYLGPTLGQSENADLLSGCIVRPPLRRGELYRDRTIGGSVFLVVDGAFFHNQAVSPREVIDVIRDGALVLGAASMGALRAAECWPCGMQGVGAIYRLFRRGSLGSDDEVAVAYSEEAPRGSSTVALVNVRYAMWKAVRSGLLDRVSARRVVECAAQAHFAERHWPSLLRTAGVDARLFPFVTQWDLKALDAKRGLWRLKRLFSKPASAALHRRGGAPFVPSEAARELPYDPNLGTAAAVIDREVCKWLVVSGRYRRYHQQRLPALSDRVALGRIWREVVLRGERDSEVFCWRAVQVAAERSMSKNVSAPAWALQAAGNALAIEHGFQSVDELKASLKRRRGLADELDRYLNVLSSALWAARGA